MVVEIIFALALIFFAGMSIILEHHWMSYTGNSKSLFLARLFYYGGSSVFFLLALGAFRNIL